MVSRNILVIDDHPIITRTISQLFRQHTVVGATTGREAMFHARIRFFDLYIVDYALPDMEGVDLMRQLRAIHPEGRIMVYSGLAQPAHTRSHPWNDWIEKAGDVSTLIEHVEALLAT